MSITLLRQISAYFDKGSLKCSLSENVYYNQRRRHTQFISISALNLATSIFSNRLTDSVPKILTTLRTFTVF